MKITVPRMRLSFRYQFLLAPAVMISLLIGLIIYNLMLLPRLNREHEIPRQWAIVTDRALVMMASAKNLEELVSNKALKTQEWEDLQFDYFEQVQIYLDNAQNPDLLARAPEDIRHIIQTSNLRLLQPKYVNPADLRITIATLLPALQQLAAGFESKRRSAFMGYHHNARILVGQLINASLAVLSASIILGAGLVAWGLYISRRRLAALSQLAQKACSRDIRPSLSKAHNDELDILDDCLVALTQRLLHTVAVEKILQGAEDERRRIAMDMHDGILAELTTLSRTLCQTESEHQKSLKVAILHTRLDELAESIRRVIEDLHPQSLEILGFEAALRSYLERNILGLGMPEYNFEFDPNIENALRSSHKIHLFRIVSEALHNVLRHSRCKRFEISIRVVSHTLRCTIEDNGVGMPSGQESKTSPSHGRLNILERAHIIGAQASWGKSRFSTGTRFELSLPLGP